MRKENGHKSTTEPKGFEPILLLSNLIHLPSLFDLRFDGDTKPASIKKIIRFLKSLRDSGEKHEFVYGLSFSVRDLPHNDLLDNVRVRTLDPKSIVLESVSLHDGIRKEYDHFDYDFSEPSIIYDVDGVIHNPGILTRTIIGELQLSSQKRQVYLYGTTDKYLVVGRPESFRSFVNSQPIVSLSRQEAARMSHDLFKFTSFVARGLIGGLR